MKDLTPTITIKNSDLPPEGDHHCSITISESELPPKVNDVPDIKIEESELPPKNENYLDKTIADIPPITNAGVDVIKSKEYISEIVEPPLVKACEHLFDLGICTTYSSANRKDLKDPPHEGLISLDWTTLSEANKEIGKRIGRLNDAKTVLRICIPLSGDMKVREFEEKSLKLVKQFTKQPPVWIERYICSPEVFIASKEPLTEQEIEELVEEYNDIYYDKSSRKFFPSKELYDKYSEYF
jgi:hypothetical protein